MNRGIQMVSGYPFTVLPHVHSCTHIHWFDRVVVKSSISKVLFKAWNNPGWPFPYITNLLLTWSRHPFRLIWTRRMGPPDPNALCLRRGV